MFNPNTQCDSIWGWGYGRRLGHEAGALTDGIRVLLKEQDLSLERPATLERPLTPSATLGTARGGPSVNQEVSSHHMPNPPEP